MTRPFIRESVAKTITPRMQTALSAMCKGALELTKEGWRSTNGVVGTWNSHTVSWLARNQYCAIAGRQASITRYGKEILISVQGWAA